jgi:aminoglycoside N3'-acetyltransferase
MSFTANAMALLSALGDGPVFVHSDVFRTVRLVPPSRDRRTLLDAHVDLLKRVSGDRGLWLPSFNYDFPRSGVFDVADDESQVGPIPEHFRTSAAEWRTPVPMFSVAGTGSAPLIEWGEDTNPFGVDSIFARLVAEDGVVLYYGDTFSSNTLVHFAESAYGAPPYRYDKQFPGEVIMEHGDPVRGSLCCHVRPLGGDLDYDWPGLLALAVQVGVCKAVEGHPEVMAASARSLSEHWVREMRDDPLALLNAKSRAWVEPALDELGRRFMITDFESPVITRST